MKQLALAVALAIASFGLGAAAQAMPALQVGPAPSGIIQVEGGCGPGGHRTPYGRCVSNYQRPMFRGCPPGMHVGRFGRCRPNY